MKKKIEFTLEELIYQRNVHLSNDATLNLVAYKTDRANKDGEPDFAYVTYGTVIYSDGTVIDLDPVDSSKNTSYIWDNEYIYQSRYVDNVEERVFDIKERKYKDIKISWDDGREIAKSSTNDNSSITFYRIQDLKKGNRLLIDRYWNEENLMEFYNLLNNKGEVSYITTRTICSPNDYDTECMAIDKDMIYFYENDVNGIYLTRACDISSGRAIMHGYMDDYLEKIDINKVKELIK